eukprot:jgi/Ulvmu1/4625/UM002_0356.1
MGRQRDPCAKRRPLWCSCLAIVLTTATSRRSLLQSDNVQCLAFVPFQASDYQYIRSLANERRRESFAISRSRGRDTSGEVSADSPWSFESLNGTESDGERQALTAFPKMNKRSDDLFSAFFIASVEDETGVDINDSVGKSTKQPYYFVQTVCDGNCQDLTPNERASVDANARSSRAVISCVDKEKLAEDPFAIALPFTPDEDVPPPDATALTFGDALNTASTGQSVVFTSPGAQADMDAAEADNESEAPLDELFVPAPSLPPLPVVPPATVPPIPAAAPLALAPDALPPGINPIPGPVPLEAPLPGVMPMEAPGPGAPVPGPLGPLPGMMPALALPPGAPLPVQPTLDGDIRGVAPTVTPRGLPPGAVSGPGGDGGPGSNGGTGGQGGPADGGGAGGDAGVESNQADTDMPASESYDVDWVIVCLAIAGTVAVGALAALIRHGAIAQGYTCCQCACCGALVGKHPSRSDSSASSGAILPLHHGISLLTPNAGAIFGSAFEASSPGTSHGSVAAMPAAASSSSGSVMGPPGSAGRAGAQPIATTSSGEDSLDNWAQMAGGGAGMRDLGTATSNMSSTIGHGTLGPSGSAIFRTTSHSGSVSLAYLAMPHQSATNLGSSNSNALSHGESSAMNSGDSANLPSATAAGTPAASSTGNGTPSAGSTVPLIGMAAVAAVSPSSATAEGGASPAAASEEHAVLRSPQEVRQPVVQLASRQRTIGQADVSGVEERKAAAAASGMSPTQARILGTVKEETDSREGTVEMREGTASARLAGGLTQEASRIDEESERSEERSEGSSEGMATTLDEIASKMEGVSDRGLDTEGTETTDGDGVLSSAQLLAESAAGQAAHERDQLLAQHGNRSDRTSAVVADRVAGLGPSQARRHVYTPPLAAGAQRTQEGADATAEAGDVAWRPARDTGNSQGSSTSASMSMLLPQLPQESAAVDKTGTGNDQP